MLKGAIARRYAGAIFEIGRKQNALDRTLEDVKGIAEVFAHRTLAYLLRQRFPRSVKRQPYARLWQVRCCLHRSTSLCSLSSVNW